jgi:CRP-like cAMP-binding protein
MNQAIGRGLDTIDPRRNILLSGLPPDDFERIAPKLEPVRLARSVELDRPNEEIEHVYFPTSGMASIVALGDAGESVDTTMVGREGMTGLAVFLGTGQMPVRTIVQVPVEGVRMRDRDRSAADREGNAPVPRAGRDPDAPRCRRA